MTTTTKHLIPTLLFVLTLGLVVEAQPGQGAYGRERGMQPGPNRQGPQMGRVDREGPGPEQRQGAGMGIVPLLGRLDLTESQHKAIRTILEADREADQAAQQAVQKARQSLHEAVIEGADDESIRAIATTLAQAVGDQAIQQVAVTKKIKGVLTDAQMQSLKTLMTQVREDRPRGPWGQARGMGRGPDNDPGRRPGRGPRQRRQGPQE